jgi:TRAP-type transport system small permease protein
MFRSFDQGLQKLTAWVCVLLAAQMTVVVLVGVFWRYVLNDALAWAEELARYTMIWMSWLGGGLALRRGGHLAAEFAIDRLPPGARRMIILAGQVLALGFLLIVLWYGVALTRNVALQTTSALRVSMQFPYSAMPVGALLMIYHLVVLMLRPGLAERQGAELQV